MPPVPETPTIVCTPGYTAYLYEHMQKSGVGIVTDVFNINDGPSPYDIFSAQIIGIQATIYDLAVTSLGNNRYQLTGFIRPSIMIEYSDGNGFDRAKLASISIPVQAAFNATVPISEISFVSYLDHTSLTDPVFADNTLTFSYVVQVTLLGVDREARNFAVVENYDETGSLPEYLPTQAVSQLPIRGICDLISPINVYTSGIIPFAPEGEEPYMVTNLEPLATGVNLIDISTDASGGTEFHVAFPVSITLISSDYVVSTQQSLLYTRFTVENITPEAGARFLLSLSFTTSVLPNVVGNIILVTNGVITGIVSQTDENVVTNTVAEFVRCGIPQHCACIVPTYMTTEQQTQGPIE